MKSVFTHILFLCLSVAMTAQVSTLEGVVKNSSGESLIGANVLIPSLKLGTTTDVDGTYMISVPSGTYDVEVSYIGYSGMTKTVTIDGGTSFDFELSEGTELDQIVISGSKRAEKLTNSPATIETIHAREIEEYAGNPGELIARQKGVDYFRAGIAAPAFNIRGFNSNFNSKNLQVTDGRISQLIATGLPIGPLSSTIKEDIEQIELILGPNSTLYGPNAHNGLLNTITKDPRTSQGTTIVFNPGVTGDGDAFYSGRIRHAQKVNDKFAFKVSGEYTKATEFEYSDSVYIDRVGAFDDMGNAIPDGITEAYEEFELDRNVDFLKGEATMIYSPNDDLDISFNTGYSNSNYLSPTNVGRNQIKDWSLNHYQLKMSNDRWFAQVYYTISKSDSTYAIDQRTKNYYALKDAGFSEADARGTNSYGNGAIFIDDSRRWNAEIQYNNTFGDFEFIGGFQYQLDQANSHGTYLLDEDEDDYIEVGQYGGYGHLSYEFGNGWEALGALRADYHEIYELNLVPKLGLLRKGDLGTWRLTYGEGIASPTILNLYGNLFGGLILGNSDGFTLTDGTVVDKQRVEKIQTFEIGYRGLNSKKNLVFDANAYYNISKDFLSPVTVVGVATHRGDTPISEVQDLYAAYGGLVATYINFGKVNTYGFDVGATYYFNPKVSVTGSYSYFDYSVDDQNLENDFNKDGVVNFLDVLVNAPNHKANMSLNYSDGKFFGSIFGRWVESYDYFSSYQIASSSHEGIFYRGTEIVEDARSTDSYNYGPLGGFVTMDLSLGYRVNEMFTVSASAVNVFNQELREFTAAAPTKGMYTLELKLKLPAKASRK